MCWLKSLQSLLKKSHVDVLEITGKFSSIVFCFLKFNLITLQVIILFQLLVQRLLTDTCEWQDYQVLSRLGLDACMLYLKSRRP